MRLNSTRTRHVLARHLPVFASLLGLPILLLTHWPAGAITFVLAPFWVAAIFLVARWQLRYPVALTLLGAFDGLIWAVVMTRIPEPTVLLLSLLLTHLQAMRSRGAGIAFSLTWPLSLLIEPAMVERWSTSGIVVTLVAIPIVVYTARAAGMQYATGLAVFSKVGHEFNTPLTNITHALHSLADSRLTPRQREDLGSMETNASYMSFIVRNAADFARIFSGRYVLHPAPHHLADLARQCLQMMTPMARRRMVALNFYFFGSPQQLTVDAEALRIVLYNLIGNALKFTQHGSVDVFFICEPRRASNHIWQRLADAADRWLAARPLHHHQLSIVVRDTGPGFHAEILPQLGRQFINGNRFHPETRGTGLGVSMVKNLIDMMGGDMRARNRSDQSGAEVMVRTLVGVGSIRKLARSVIYPTINVFSNNTAVVNTIVAAAPGSLIQQRNTVAEFLSCLRAPHTNQACIAVLDAAALGLPLPLFVRRHQVALAGTPIIGLLADTAPNWMDLTLAAVPQLNTVIPANADIDGWRDALFAAALRLAPDAGRKQRQREHANVLSGIRVLLAEDDPAQSAWYTALLTEAGATVSAFADGRVALDAVLTARDAVDILLLDHTLPGKSGRDIVDALRATEQAHGERQTLAVVAMTAEHSTEHLFAPGSVYRVLTKPFSAGDLTATLGAALGRPPVAALAPSAPAASAQAEESSAEIDALFRHEMERAIGGLADALRLGDADAFHGIVHRLKGNAGTWGAQGVHQHCMRLDKDVSLEQVPSGWLADLRGIWAQENAAYERRHHHNIQPPTATRSR